MRPPIQALFFDFDGLIFDTETTEMLVWKRIYAEYGCEYPEDRWAQNAGLWGDNHRFDSAAHLQDLLQHPLDLQALNQRHHDESAAAFLTQPAREGVVQYLDDALRFGLRLAVASSSPLHWVSGHLTRLGLISRFERIVSGDDVTPDRVKPQPDIYLKALDLMQVAPQAAIAFEDSSHGLIAARAAGLYTVAVPNPTTARLRLPPANLEILSLADLPLEFLLLIVAQAAPSS